MTMSGSAEATMCFESGLYFVLCSNLHKINYVCELNGLIEDLLANRGSLAVDPYHPAELRMSV